MEVADKDRRTRLSLAEVELQENINGYDNACFSVWVRPGASQGKG